MATGGRISSPEEADIYTCGICLEHMGNRKPRLLSCHHSFCEDCMRKLVKEKCITCPTCRIITPVLQNDVTTLSINFFLLQVLEREEVKEAKPNVNICQFCNREKAENLCDVCNELLCGNCTLQHNKVQQFRDHIVKVLCKEHFKVVSHVCIQCCVPVCVKCIVLMHGDHETKVKEYANGMDIIQQKITEKIINVQTVMHSLSIETIQNENKIHETDALIARLEAKRLKYFLKMKKYEKVLRDIEINCVTNDMASRRSYRLVEDKWKKLTQEITETFGPDNIPILHKVVKLQYKEKEALDEIRKQPLLKHVSPPSSLTEVDSDDETEITVQGVVPQPPRSLRPHRPPNDPNVIESETDRISQGNCDNVKAKSTVNQSVMGPVKSVTGSTASPVMTSSVMPSTVNAAAIAQFFQKKSELEQSYSGVRRSTQGLDSGQSACDRSANIRVDYDLYSTPCDRCGKYHSGDTYEDQLHKYICENTL